MKRLLALVLVVVGATGFARDILRQVSESVDQMVRKGGKPVVLLDLDDTVIDTQARVARILREFASQPAVQNQFPTESARLRNAQPGQMKFRLKATLDSLGIQSPAFHAQAKAFWGKRMFSNSYVAADEAFPGASEYVNALHRKGAIIVYLTGRTRDLMERGTVSSLQRHRFPLGARATLIMQPDRETPDRDFKLQAFDAIARMGTVVAAFENEPENLNAMGNYFTGALLVFIDTVHSDKDVAPHPRAHWIKGYANRER